MRQILWFSISLLAALVCIEGCKNDQPVNSPSPGHVLMFFYLQGDSQWIAPCDSPYVEGYALLQDESDHGMAGIELSIGNTQDSLGRIEYFSPNRDITDLTGRVVFSYHSYGRTGHDTICARAGEALGWKPVFLVRNWRRLRPVRYSFQTDTSHFQRDSVRATLCFTDTTGYGVCGIPLTLRTPEGYLQHLPPTDYNGRSVAWWHMTSPYGQYCVFYEYAEAVDSLCVQVFAPPDQKPEPAIGNGL